MSYSGKSTDYKSAYINIIENKKSRSDKRLKRWEQVKAQRSKEFLTNDENKTIESVFTNIENSNNEIEIIIDNDISIDVKNDPLRINEDTKTILPILKHSDVTTQICIDNDLSIDIKEEPLRLNEAGKKHNMFVPQTQLAEEVDDRILKKSESINETLQKDIEYKLYVFNGEPIQGDWGLYNKIFCCFPITTDEIFFRHLRIFPYQFNKIYDIVGPSLLANSKFSKDQSVHPQAELAITIAFLTQGYTFDKLALEFRLLPTNIHTIIIKVCKILYKELEPLYLKNQLDENYEKISNDFWEKYKFPHTIGTISGKILRNNLKSKIILLASCDSNHNFLWANSNKLTAQTKSSIIKMSFQELANISANLPYKSPNSNLNMPHFHVGTPPMPLMVELMRPYKADKLTLKEQNFNYKVSEITNIIEKSFEMLVNRFWFYKNHVKSPISTIQIAVNATIPLYNCLRQTGADIPAPLKVESKLQDICDDFGEYFLSLTAISNQNIVAELLEFPTHSVILIEDDPETDVIVID